MRKIIFSLAGLLAFGSIIAQPVSDNAIIPVSVTINSILRLNVTSGGNIEFNVNTLKQYEDGINNTAATTTTFTVASSLDFVVTMFSEDGVMYGSDLIAGGAGLPLDNIGYEVKYLGTGAGALPTNFTFLPVDGVVTNLKTTPGEPIITSNPTLGAGDIVRNKFSIEWELGTRGIDMNSASLLEQNVAADRYSTNVFLVLSPL